MKALASVMFAACAALGAVMLSGAAALPRTLQSAPERGVRCPDGYRAEYTASTGVLRCHRDEIDVSIAVCPDPAYGEYVVQRGRDACAASALPGVRATGLRATACPSPGFLVVPDREGLRDRCERSRRTFAYPIPLP
jgi:hypothetical protein